MDPIDLDAPTRGAQTLRRGLAVLRLLARAGAGGLRMAEIGRRVALKKATVVRLTRTLVDEGFVGRTSTWSRSLSQTFTKPCRT